MGIFSKKIDTMSCLNNKEIILDHLQKYGSINTWEAIKYYGNTRLSQYILLLRREGFNITSKTICTKNRYNKNCHYNQYILNKC